MPDRRFFARSFARSFFSSGATCSKVRVAPGSIAVTRTSEAPKRPSTAALTLLDWCIEYFADNGQGRIARRLARGRNDVVERLKGNPTTDFGAPAIPARRESKPMTAKETERMVALMDACWRYLDQVRARAPQALRKGPRGGGRDRDKMYQHVLDAELEYAKRIGLRLKQPDHKALLESFSNPNREEKWPVPYVVRRTAWHALDHAWEMEDRIT